MPEIDLSTFANTPAAELEIMRRNLVTKAAGSHDNLSIEELHTLAAITGVLRRKASGPPKAAKEKSSRAKPAKATIDDLA